MDKVKHVKYDLERLKQFRQWMHQNAENSWKEFKTWQAIKDYGVSVGVPDELFVQYVGTGWRVEVQGKGQPFGKPKTIALRSDHDALKMAENNPDLPYKTQTDAAHMCGHDGHTSCMLGGLSLLMDNLELIPADRKVVFIFQPAEEAAGGAKKMVEAGVMNGVDEVYGCHNFPVSGTKHKILVNDREMMSSMTILHIRVTGKGGHGSSPEKANNPIPIAARAYIEILDRLNEYQKTKSGLVRFSLCTFNAGSACNVIPAHVDITGTLREFKKED